jgi:hypothetical protein
MPLTKLQFRPGINRETTAYANEGGWIDGDKIRFRAGFPETIGGWSRFSNTPMLGVARSLFVWTALDGDNLAASGTNLKYYIFEGGLPADITPIRSTTAAGDVTFSATDGSTTITVTDTNHGARADDFVTFSGAVSLGGTVTAEVLNAEYQILSIPTSSTFTFEIAAAANASDTGNGGASAVGAYQITTGQDSAVYGNGWGAGPWGRAGWGEGASTTVAGEQIRVWSQDNYGEDLLICPRNDGIYLWDRSGGTTTRAVNIASLAGSSAAPTIAQQVLVSERDRHTIALGCDSQFDVGVQDPMLIRFASQESLTDWDTTLSTGTAGEVRLSNGSYIIGAIQTKQQILVFTDASLYTMQFIGPPYTFSVQEVSAGVSVIGSTGMAAVGDAVYWMGRGDFHRYDGVAQTLPCDVKEFVFTDINYDQASKICAGGNEAFTEVWWFYPSANSDNNDRYVVYNYVQGIWYYGTMGRSAWMNSSLLDYPLAASTDGYLYYQEFGQDDGSVNPPGPINAYIESSVVDLGEGDKFMFARRLIPDLTFRDSAAALPSATFTIKARNFPGDLFGREDANAVTKTATLPVEQFTDQLHIRIRGRSMSIRVESEQTGTAWRLGTPRIDLRTDGGR